MNHPVGTVIIMMFFSFSAYLYKTFVSDIRLEKYIIFIFLKLKTENKRFYNFKIVGII